VILKIGIPRQRLYLLNGSKLIKVLKLYDQDLAKNYWEEFLNETAKNVITNHEKALIVLEVCENYITIN